MKRKDTLFILDLQLKKLQFTIFFCRIINHSPLKHLTLLQLLNKLAEQLKNVIVSR